MFSRLIILFSSRAEPKIKIGIPMLGLPYTAVPKYLGTRAVKSGLPAGPPTCPPSIESLFEPKSTDAHAYTGKKILSLQGAADSMVPFSEGEQDIEAVRRVIGDGSLEVWQQDGIGHMLTPEMVRRASGWITRWALSEAPVSK